MATQNFTATTKTKQVVTMTADITERGEIQAQYPYVYFPVPQPNGAKIWKYCIKLDASQARDVLNVALPKTMKFASISMDDQDGFKAFLQDAERAKDAWNAAQKDRAMQTEIIGFIFERGCDTADRAEFIYNFDADLDFTARYARKKADAELAKRVAAMVAANHEGYEAIPSTLSTYGGYKLTAAQVDALLNPAKAEEQAAATQKSEKVAAEAARIAAMFETAKTTGTKQVLESYMAECHDGREECSQDVVTVYAMPDGTTTTERQHTW